MPLITGTRPPQQGETPCNPPPPPPAFERLKHALRQGRRQLAALALLLSAVALPNAAQAAVITFEGPDLTCGNSGTPIPNGYAGLNWSNFYCVNGTTNVHNPSGYFNGRVSPDNVANNGFENPATLTITAPGGAKFNLNSVYLTAAWNDNLNVQIVASRNGTTVATLNYTVQTSGPTQVTPALVNIDQVAFSSSGGTAHWPIGSYTHFVMDDLDISFGPSAATNAATAITATGATLNGSVNDNTATTTASFEYGPTTAYGTTAAATPGTINAGSGDTAVSAVLSALACNTTYHYRVNASNANGDTAGGDQSFTTSACPPPGATTNPATSITATGATLNGSVNDNAAATTASFEWGTTAAYGSTAAATPATIAAGSGNTPVSVTLVSGLACNTTYHYQVNASNANGTTPGGDQSFITSACVPGAPTIGAATAGVGRATVAFTPPASDGGAAITSYTVTCEPGGIAASGSASPITVAGLSSGQAYTCSVTATNSAGTGPASAAASVTPLLPAPVPTLSQWGLLLLGTLLGATALRRRAARG